MALACTEPIMPEPTRQYLFTARQIKSMFAGVTVLMLLALVVMLLLITARPQGAFRAADTGRFETTLASSAEELSGYRQLEDGTVQIDIDRALELVAERGVSNPFTRAGATGDGAGGPGAGQPGQDAEGGRAQAAATVGVDGAQVYSNCAACHQGNGAGLPGAFPPLAGHAADLYQADPAYLAQVVLFGLQGPIEVQGASYNGLMPDWHRTLSDAEIAALLNFMLSTWGNEEEVEEEEPYSEGEIAELRDLQLTPQQVHERRQELDLH